MSSVFEAYRTTVGKKFVVAVTGVILFLFVLGHMIGNLQLFAGPETLNAYAAFLQGMGGVLWVIRAVLLLTLGVHVITTLLLFLQNWGSRPVRYRVKKTREVDYSARTMVWTGPIVATFVLYHLLHFTLGTLHHDFIEGDVYHNVVSGFLIWWVAAVYMVANLLLGFHLKHGLWSWFQTLGLAHPKYNTWRNRFALFFAGLIIVGNLSMPVAVLAGLVS
jgi:succinate dehydrogenase / fumarate reductase, cytochrome b subunit